jgi:predicted PhzF superfamily epimerase YddE/YHI9
VLFNYEGYRGESISFNSRSGMLNVSRFGELMTLDFPIDNISSVNVTHELKSIFSEPVKQILKGKTDYIFVFESEADVKNCKPDFFKIAKLEARGAIITAKGIEVDFVSRFFGPKAGIDEDPVTGSAHTTLTPYWASVLGKTKLKAAQLSARGGELECELKGDRVMISGTAKLFSTGLIYLD